jgi:hypothetical protein
MSKVAVLERKSETTNYDPPVSARNAEIEALVRGEEDNSAPDRQISHEQIEQLAYSLWEQGGCREGTAEDDWFRAEDMLRIRRSTAASA